MIIRLDQMIKVTSSALDIVEGELLGVKRDHGKRIACLAAAAGRRLNMPEETLRSLSVCALFHDSALTEYILAHEDGAKESDKRLHCEYGQRNADNLLGEGAAPGFVLYHHERADGKGLFGKKAGEFPQAAEIISACDLIDLQSLLSDPAEKPGIIAFIKECSGTVFTEPVCSALLSAIDGGCLELLTDGKLDETTDALFPEWPVEADRSIVFRFAALISYIIDCKSPFTKRHSQQIANKAWLMGGFYNYERDERALLYLAAAFHDIGKLGTPNSILDKPGALTPEEFKIIQAHSALTEELLSRVDGFEKITLWACSHHEKLNGKGYHNGLTEERMDFNSRLLACLDIYQAVSEERPYHPARAHEDTMPILYDMAKKGLIDADISRGLDEALAEYSLRDVPPPERTTE
ncbi:MAG: HD domain-containing protein [Clostridiales bacterium]|jgi:HD-GYP domain-containing protein (c-di-GMP phosphodiesterase class II)|nr:HD domain-containing protein [Clostridiales bacterium]